MTETISADDLELVRQRAGGVLSEGGLVVVPTDTAYAVLADAFQMDATQRLFSVRHADPAHPLPVIVRNPRQLPGLVKEQSEQAKRLMAAFWPGALTLVFTANIGLAWDLGDTRGTVSVRMPDEPLIYELVKEVGPLACTAAVLAGAPPARTVDEARAALGEEVAVYVDGGPRPGARSTIVDVSRGGAEVLRVGVVSADDVFAAATGAVAWGRPTGDPGDAAPTSERAAGQSRDRQDGAAGDDEAGGAPGDDEAGGDPGAPSGQDEGSATRRGGRVESRTTLSRADDPSAEQRRDPAGRVETATQEDDREEPRG